MSDIILFKLV